MDIILTKITHAPQLSKASVFFVCAAPFLAGICLPPQASYDDFLESGPDPAAGDSRRHAMPGLGPAYALLAEATSHRTIGDAFRLLTFEKPTTPKLFAIIVCAHALLQWCVHGPKPYPGGFSRR